MKMNTKIMVLCIALIMFSIFHIWKQPTIDIVIARYNEDIDWVCKEIKRVISNSSCKTSIYIYNKGNDFDPEILESFRREANVYVIQLPNVGRCDHTYLYHIINKYSMLADVTVFLPASCNMDYKDNKTRLTLEAVYKEKNTVFFYEDPSNIYDEAKDFALTKWISSHESNKINDDDSMQLANPRPFGEWYLHIFDANDIYYKSISYFGILAVSRNHIMNRNKSFYENLITHVDKHHNPEAGHYIERSWSTIFKIPEDRKFDIETWNNIASTFEGTRNQFLHNFACLTI